MAKAPWFPFYTGDFLASTDVQLMEAHEVGAYLLLLAHSWQSDAPGYLPNDAGRLRRLARLSAEQWKESGSLLLSKWPEAPEDDSLRHNPRLVKEAGKQVEMREVKAEAGRKSAERRARLATEGQQSGNTNPTGVEIPATGVGQKPNYSQSQSQPQSQEGKPSASLRSAGAANAAASAPEKKIDRSEASFESPPAAASHTGAATDVPTRKGRKGAAPVPALTGPLAVLLNAGGVAHEVQSLKSPLTQAEADALVAEYGPAPAAQIVQEMANYAKLHGYTSANLTARNWLKKRSLTPITAAHATPYANSANRYHTTARGGFGGFANKGQQPGSVAAQPGGSAAAGGGAGQVPAPTR